MTILKGHQILEKLQRKIKDPDYKSYDELNESQEWMAHQTSYTWLRDRSVNTLGMTADTRSYDLNVANARSIQNIWAAAASTDTAVSLSAITLTSGVVVAITTSAVHSLTTGDNVTFASVGGTTELNGNDYAVTVTSTTTFTLDGTDGDDFTAYTSGGTVSKYNSTSTAWKLMVETPLKLFEDKVRENVGTDSSSGVIDSSGDALVISSDSATRTKWYYSLRSSSTAPFWTVMVTPVPSKNYKIRVDYIRIQNAITETGFPDIPYAYTHMLINYAAGLILERSEEPAKAALGGRYIARASSDVLKIVWDSQKNRTKNIDRRKRAWIK